MTQTEFIELSKNEVQSLDGNQDQENVLEAWRDGYIYLQQYIRSCLNNCNNSDFLDRMEMIAYADIDVFDQ